MRKERFKAYSTDILDLKFSDICAFSLHPSRLRRRFILIFRILQSLRKWNEAIPQAGRGERQCPAVMVE
jgi:hypothetical protein